MLAHYSTAALPAGPRKAEDKPKVEVAVQVVERWVLARLRHQQFFSLAEIDRALGGLIEHLNNQPFKKLPGTRRSQYEALDVTATTMADAFLQQLEQPNTQQLSLKSDWRCS